MHLEDCTDLYSRHTCLFSQQLFISSVVSPSRPTDWWQQVSPRINLPGFRRSVGGSLPPGLYFLPSVESLEPCRARPPNSDVLEYSEWSRTSLWWCSGQARGTRDIWDMAVLFFNKFRSKFKPYDVLCHNSLSPLAILSQISNFQDIFLVIYQHDIW